MIGPPGLGSALDSAGPPTPPAIRSFTDPPGLRYSTFASTRDAVSPTVLARRDGGVSAIRSSTELAFVMRPTYRPPRLRSEGRCGPRMQARHPSGSHQFSHQPHVTQKLVHTSQRSHYLIAIALRGRHAEMTVTSSRSVVRAALGVLVLGIALRPTLASAPSQAKAKKSSLPQYRATSAPNTFYPLGASKRVKDRKTWSRRHLGTDISTPCGSSARAVHPGTAQVATNPAWGGKVVVRVGSNHNGLVTSYGFLWRAAVQQGQIVQSGQALGTVGGQPRTGR